jgi:hypothetical protein
MASGAGGSGRANDAAVAARSHIDGQATDQELLDLAAVQAEDHAGRLVAKVANMTTQLGEARAALAEAKTAAKAAREAASAGVDQDGED